MMEIFSISCLVAMILLVWNHSEAFIEYSTLFNGNRFFLIDDFREAQKKDPAIDYLSYLQTEHDTFLVRLITCPLCFSIWLTLIICLIVGDFTVYPMCNILGLIIYKFTIRLIWW